MDRKVDIHDYDRRYENAKRGIEKADIPNTNKDFIGVIFS